MKTKKFLFYVLAALLGGCIPVMSLHPLYTEEDVVFEKKLLGTWVDDSNETTWEFKRIVEDSNISSGLGEFRFRDPDESEKAYELVYSSSDGNKGSFFAHLVKLNNRFFLDVYPSQLPFAGAFETLARAWETASRKEPNDQNPWGLDPNKLEFWTCNFWFLLPLHTFIKINGIEPQLKLQLTDDDELKKLLKKDPNAVEHTLVYEDKLVLTASTKELQAFVLKYADDSRVFTAEVVLARKEIKSPQASPEKDPNEAPKGK